MVFRGLGCGLSPFWGFCVPIGLVWSYDIRSVRGYSIHTLSLTCSPSSRCRLGVCARSSPSGSWTRLRCLRPPAAALLVAGAAPAPPPLALAQAPVARAVAVSAGGESYADVLGDNA